MAIQGTQPPADADAAVSRWNTIPSHVDGGIAHARKKQPPYADATTGVPEEPAVHPDVPSHIRNSVVVSPSPVIETLEDALVEKEKLRWRYWVTDGVDVVDVVLLEEMEVENDDVGERDVVLRSRCTRAPCPSHVPPVAVTSMDTPASTIEGSHELVVSEEMLTTEGFAPRISRGSGTITPARQPEGNTQTVYMPPYRNVAGYEPVPKPELLEGLVRYWYEKGLPMESMANSLDTALALQATIVPLKIPAQSPHDPGRVALLALVGKVGGWVEQGGESTFSKSPATSKLTSVSAGEGEFAIEAGPAISTGLNSNQRPPHIR
jgi:hypothetical protein